MLLKIFQVQQLEGDAGAAQFGMDPARVSSRAPSLSPSSASQVSPIALARLRTDATPPALIPRLRAVSRWLRRKCHFRPKISRLCRMGSRSVAITFSAERCSAKSAMVKRCPASLLHPVQHVSRCRIGDHDAWIGDHDPWNAEHF
jgi:hypothetical protein